MVAEALSVNPTRRKASAIVKRSVAVSGHKTSITLEFDFWARLKEIARQREITMSVLLGEIAGARQGNSNLSSACRLFVLRELLGQIERKPQ
jgi:predicted DNA-binding ribbon-helix-helix protein